MGNGEKFMHVVAEGRHPGIERRPDRPLLNGLTYLARDAALGSLRQSLGLLSEP